VLTEFPGTTMARATALARQADGRLVVAGIACASGSGPQCAGGTARLALARYQGGDAPAAPPGTGVVDARTRKAARFVRLPRRLTARHGKAKLLLHCLQARRCRGTLSLRRLRTKRGPLLIGSRTVSLRARRAATVTVTLRRKRLGSSRRLRVRVEFSGRDLTGVKRTVSRTAMLRRG
jgi:hypothetical protein